MGSSEVIQEELALTDVMVFRTNVGALLYTGATPNLMSSEVAESLHLQPTVTSRSVSMADDSALQVVGELQRVPVTVGNITKELTFLVVPKSPFPLLIRRPSLRVLRAKLDFEHDIATFKEGEVVVELPMRGVNPGKLCTVSDEFTSAKETQEDDSFDSEGGESNTESEHCVLCLRERDGKAKEDNEEAALGRALGHLPERLKEELEQMFFEGGSIIGWELEDLQQADVPFRHSFKQTNDQPINIPTRRMPPKHSTIVSNEINRMLRAGIIRQSASPWGAPVVIANKADGSPSFCVDYRELNKVMVAESWLAPNAKDIIEELKGAQVFSRLDMLSGYWQIRLDGKVAEKTTFKCKEGTFMFTVMPFGLMNAPACFHR